MESNKSEFVTKKNYNRRMLLHPQTHKLGYSFKLHHSQISTVGEGDLEEGTG